MQDEAEAVLCSGKNIFYLPFGAMGQFYDWAYRTMRTIPPVKKLDCAFDMRDVAENTSAMVQRMKAENRLDVVGDDFERLSRSEKAELLHHESIGDLLCVWTDKIHAFSVHDLDLLRLDLSNCRCLSGCCWLGQELLENLDFDQTYAEYPRRIEIIGALKEEEDLWRAAVGRGSDVPLERVFFIDAPEHV
ncbi:hypothetical protein HO173_007736 [Letharia columbiana]|uniref:Uncharacterized protein n=1 Tax=Letharia columbiana TaxID=112416 RepID=A0A8H6L396_9LECA|nr:uncharacterized protein HO173_007736 [Letharia columbiana]KAF6233906.1 hypothetical protein HO173_007736 [Letharia columbiana]